MPVERRRSSFGGFIGKLPEAGRKEIERRFPAAPIDQIEKAAMDYILERDSGKALSPADKERKFLRGLSNKAKALLHDLESSLAHQLGHEIELHALPISAGPPYDEPEPWFGAGKLRDRTRELLAELAIAAVKAERSIPRGPRIKPRTWLVWELKSALDQVGMSTGADKGSDLCTVVEIILGALGEAEGTKEGRVDASKVVSGAFGERRAEKRDK